MTNVLRFLRRDRRPHVAIVDAARLDGIAIDSKPAAAIILRAWYRPATDCSPARYVVSELCSGKRGVSYDANPNAINPARAAIAVYCATHGLELDQLHRVNEDATYALVAPSRTIAKAA